jgi:hypothetical protein
MVIAVFVQIVPAVEQFLDFSHFFFWVANLVPNHPSLLHYFFVIKRAVVHICLLGVTTKIVEFIHVDTVSWVRHDF